MAELTGRPAAGAQLGQRDQGRRQALLRAGPAGEDVVLPARPVTVHRFDVLASRRGRRPTARTCSTSTSRSTCPPAPTSAPWPATSARALGVGGHLTALRRTRVGRFDLATASTMEQLQAARDTGDGVPLVPLADAARASFALRELSAAEATAVGHGQRIPVGPAAAHRTGGGLRPRRCAGGHAGRARHAGEGPRRVRPLGFVECPPCCDGRTSPRSPRASVRAW